jgi:phosphonate transport system substrate-binding protein
LKGKKFAFGDRDSTMSHLMPRHMLLKQGVETKDLATSMHLANYDNIALSVLAGSFDAGAAKNEVFLKYQSEGLEALAFTPEVNDHLFVASALLPRQTIQALRRALLDLNHDKDGKAILSAMRADLTALVAVDDREYDNLREIIRELKRAGVSL